jgi:RNA polymerase sigma-70 factor (ECF subfamily)
VLCDIEGFSYEEIAATLGVKLGTVRSRIHRGRAQLRSALEHRRPSAGQVEAGQVTVAAAAAGPLAAPGLGRQGLVARRLKRAGEA